MYPIYICLFGYLEVGNNVLNYLHGYLVVSYGSCRKNQNLKPIFEFTFGKQYAQSFI
jgi:hypothetical protein